MFILDIKLGRNWMKNKTFSIFSVLCSQAAHLRKKKKKKQLEKNFIPMRKFRTHATWRWSCHFSGTGVKPPTLRLARLPQLYYLSVYLLLNLPHLNSQREGRKGNSEEATNTWIITKMWLWSVSSYHISNVSAVCAPTAEVSVKPRGVFFSFLTA